MKGISWTGEKETGGNRIGGDSRLKTFGCIGGGEMGGNRTESGARSKTFGWIGVGG